MRIRLEVDECCDRCVATAPAIYERAILNVGQPNGTGATITAERVHHAPGWGAVRAIGRQIATAGPTAVNPFAMGEEHRAAFAAVELVLCPECLARHRASEVVRGAGVEIVRS